MHASDLTLVIGRRTRNSDDPIAGRWSAHAHLGGLVGHCQHDINAALATEIAIDRLTIEIATTEIPEIPAFADAVRRHTLAGRGHPQTVQATYALLDRVCRICNRINTHPQRRILLTLIDDALDTHEHLDLGQQINTAIHKTDLLTNTPSPPEPSARQT